MNSFQLKILALILMTIDHIGYIFFPQQVLFRIVGRLSFPIFAFLISEGAKHTRNINRYVASLSLFALISEPIFHFALPSPVRNIFFTLVLGLLAILVYKKVDFKPLKTLLIICIASSAIIFNIDYSFYGVLTVLTFAIFEKTDKFLKLFLAQFVLTAAYVLYNVSLSLANFRLLTIWNFIQLFSLFSLLFIHYYNSQRGPKMKYFFYLFYPGHLALLKLIELKLF